MSRWAAHNDTFHCVDHPRLTARAKRYRQVEGTAPRCPTCGNPMTIKDRPQGASHDRD